jgi:hypothetical protein
MWQGIYVKKNKNKKLHLPALTASWLVDRNEISSLTLFITDIVDQGVTKRCRLSWLINIALEYEPRRGRGLRGLGQ